MKFTKMPGAGLPTAHLIPFAFSAELNVMDRSL
jgi:hypothetical protein